MIDSFSILLFVLCFALSCCSVCAVSDRDQKVQLIEGTFVSCNS